MKDELLPQVRHNCMVSDAGYWGYYSTCGLLLRLREQYRFEQGIAPGTKVDTVDVGRWIEKREADWQRLEDNPLKEITIGEKTYDPFDAKAINEAIEGEGLVYGGGHGIYMKPVFFLAELESKKTIGEITVLITGKELVRDLSIHPAMSRDNIIIVRSEIAYAMLCDKIDEYRSTKRHGALSDAFREYDITPDTPDTTDEMIRETANSELATFIHHEAGELKESKRLGPEWAAMMEALGHSRTALGLRGVKDALADTVKGGMLTHIIKGQKAGSLFFLISSLTGHRFALLSDLRAACKEFKNTRDWESIEKARIASYKAADALAVQALEIYRNTPSDELDAALALALKAACPVK